MTREKCALNELGVMKTIHFWRSRSSTSNENYTYKTLIIRVSKRNGVFENAEKMLTYVEIIENAENNSFYL